MATKNTAIEKDDCSTEVAQSLTSQTLKDFLQNKLLAIHVRNYVGNDLCSHMASELVKQPVSNWNVYDLENDYKQSDVNVVGYPFNMAARDDASWNRYFHSSQNVTDAIRNCAAPYASPLDRFRLTLDELWHKGLTTAVYQGQKMTPGLARIMYDKDVIDQNTPLNCHVDCPPIITPHMGLYSVNIYLKQPESGGHLYIWNPKIVSTLSALKNWNLVKNFFLESSYLDKEKQLTFQALLPPPIKIEVKTGDLIMINTGRPHAISPFAGGPRVSLQAFINYKKNKPLEIWS